MLRDSQAERHSALTRENEGSNPSPAAIFRSAQGNSVVRGVTDVGAECRSGRGGGLQTRSYPVRVRIGAPDSQFASRPRLFLFFSTTFLVRMAQDFKRFEQGCPQRAVLPGSFFHNHMEQPALLDGGLLEEQLARLAGQPQHVDGLIDGGRRCLLDVLDLAQQTILLHAPGARMLVEKLLADASVELVQVHGLNARLDLVVASLEFLDGLRTGRLLGLVGSEDSIPEP